MIVIRKYFPEKSLSWIVLYASTVVPALRFSFYLNILVPFLKLNSSSMIIIIILIVILQLKAQRLF